MPFSTARNWSGDIDSKPRIRRGFRPSDGPGNPNRNFIFERVGNHGQLSGWHSYRLVKRCQTLEAAQAVMKQLEDRGQTSQLVMDDGLSVVTQRD